MKNKINHKVTGWDKGYYYKTYQVFCTYQGDTVPTTYQPHNKIYECGGCNKKLNKNIFLK